MWRARSLPLVAATRSLGRCRSLAASARSNHSGGSGHKHTHAHAASAPSGTAPTDGHAPSNLPPERDVDSAAARSGWLPLPLGASRWTSAASSLLSSMGSVAPELQAKVQLRAASMLRQSLLANLPAPPPEIAVRRAQPRPPASVRIGRDAQGRRVLCDEEVSLMATRRAKARTHLARYFLGAFPATRPTVRDPPDAAAAADDSLPSIGIALSGGGHRAMLSGMGSLTAMQHQGLWDSALYVAGLSGGTWAMSQIYANPHHHALRVAEIDRMINEELARSSTAAAAVGAATERTSPLFNPLLHSPVDLKRVSEDLMRKVAHKNLFEDVPLDFIQECIVDKFALYAEEQQQLQQNAKAAAETHADNKGKPIVATSPSVTAVPVASTTTAAAPASTTVTPSPASLADRLTLTSFANVLSSIGLGDAFGWALAHKLLAPPPTVVAAAPASSVVPATPATPVATPAALRVAQLHPRLSDQIALLNRVSLPYPLWAAITRRGEQLEFTPHEVGMPGEADVYVPSYAFGARFDKGVECDDHTADATSTAAAVAAASAGDLPKQPELSFGLLLACFASAFPTRIGRILEELIYTSRDSRSEPLLRFMHSILHDRRVNLGQESAFEPTHTNNFMRGLDGAEDPRVAEHAKKHVPKALLDAAQISVMDAGLSFNVPWPPLLHPARGLDVILAFDASSPPEVLAADALRIGSEYAARFGLPFPDLRRGVQLPTAGMGSEAQQQRAIDAVLAGVRFSDAPPADESVPLTPVLVRASHSVISLFPGDVARGIPSILYLPLIANTAYETSEEYRRNSGGAAAAAAAATKANQPSTEGATAAGWASRLYASAAAAATASTSTPQAAPSGSTVVSASTPAPPPSPSSFKPGAPVASPLRSSSAPRAQPVLSSSSASASCHFDPRANFLSGGFCATLTFQLAPWQSEAIMGLSYTNAMQASGAIKSVLKAIRAEKARRLAAQREETNGSATNGASHFVR